MFHCALRPKAEESRGMQEEKDLDWKHDAPERVLVHFHIGSLIWILDEDA